MNQEVKKPKQNDGQFYYLDRWVDKKSFRAFVYNEKNETKLANSYDEFEHLISSGLWFEKIPELPQGKRKKNDITVSDS